MAELTNVITGELDLDQSPKYLTKGDYPDARNIITGTSVSSDKIRLEKIIGTVALSESLGYTVSEVLGTCTDEANGDVYFLATTTIATANKIIKKTSSNVFSTVISYDFGWVNGLIFNGVFFINDSIIWIDNSDEIKRLQLGAYPVTPTANSLDGAEITIMKKPPQTQPYCMMWTDSDTVTQVRDFDYQFATYFEYVDGGRSVLSPYSKQLPSDTGVYNRFYVYPDIPTAELDAGATEMLSQLRRQTASTFDSFPKNVKRVVVCARNIRSTTWYEVGDIKRLIDTTANNGYGKFEKSYVEFSAPLSGFAVPSTQTSTQYFVPRNPDSITVANNKLFAFNFNEGRPAPVSDLTLFSASWWTRIIGNWGLVDIHHMTLHNVAWDATTNSYKRTPTATVKYVYLDSTGFRDTNFNPATHTTTTYLSDTGAASLDGAGVQGVDPTYTRYYSTAVTKACRLADTDAVNLFDVPYADVGFGDVIESGLSYVGIGGMHFPVGGVYSVGLVFSDGFGRKSDMITKDEWRVQFSKSLLSKASTIRYDLQLEPEDIPSWATNVEVLVTGNVETSTFIEGKATGVGYRYEDPADGQIKWAATWDSTRDILGININGLTRQGQGYTFEEGDKIRLWALEESTQDSANDVDIDVPIIGVEGDWILVSGDQYIPGFTDLHQAGVKDIQIYRPRDQEADTVMYGNGISHIITQGTRNNFKGHISGDSVYSTVESYTSTFIADEVSVFKSGLDYGIKSITLDDDRVWIYSRGRAYIETGFGEVLKENYARWGANLVNDTKINGLGDFLALDEAQTPVEHGAINAVALVGDTQSAGTVILALTATKPISLYIGATTLTNSDGTNAAIKSTDEIGLVRPQEADNGTTHPESVFSRDGRVYYYDSINRCYCMYASNGVTEISKNKVSSFFRDIPLPTSTILTGYYNEYNMIMVTIKDGFGATTETIGYDVEQGKWRSFYDIFPDAYVSSNDVMYTVKSGVFYESLKRPGAANLRSFFHGAQFDSTIDVVFNDEVTSQKTWDLVKFIPDASSIEWNAAEQRLVDTAATLTFSNEDGQESVSGIADMEIEDGTVFVSVLLDANSTGGYLSGDEVRSKELVVKFTFTTSDNIQLGIVRAVYTPS